MSKLIQSSFRRSLRRFSTASSEGGSNNNSHPDFSKVIKSSSTSTTTPITNEVEERKETQEQIKQHLSESKVVLYMKGLPSQPQCGFSWKVVQILNASRIPYKAHNVLVDDSLRNEIKLFSSWPTIPQLYVDEEFIGGCDIVESLARSGELQKTFEKAGVYPATVNNNTSSTA